MTKEDFKSQNPLDVWLRGRGVSLCGSGKAKVTNRCPRAEHKKGHLCVTVDSEKNVWHCNDCSQGGDIFRWIALEQGKTDADVIREVCGPYVPTERPSVPAPSAEPSECYDYYDETGQFVYQVCRFIPKTFRQRRKGLDGEWIWNMEGVRRVLYNLPAILNPKNKYVWVVEGERDVLNLVKLGLCATTNVGGAKKWADAYSEALRGKDVILCGDNDEPGREHMKKVLESLDGKANSIRQVVVPAPAKDVSDFIESFKKTEEAQNALGLLAQSAPVLTGGIELPIQSMEELEAEYIEHLKMAAQRVLNLANWLPGLGRRCRGLHPGEMVGIIGDTGTGKTALLQNLAKAAAPLPTLLFELELPGSLTFERFCAMSESISCREVEQEYSAGTKRDWRNSGRLNHIWTCTRSKLTPDQVEMLIKKAELKMGIQPALVLLDYVQLIGGMGKRYEVISDAAESLKRIAKTTRTIIVIASQIKRKGEDDTNVVPTLHDAKESGGIENSCGLVLGASRPDHETISLKILKNTKGRADRRGEETICNFDGAKMTITERIIDTDHPDYRAPYTDK